MFAERKRRELRFEKCNTVFKVDLLTADSPCVAFAARCDLRPFSKNDSIVLSALILPNQCVQTQSGSVAQENVSPQNKDVMDGSMTVLMGQTKTTAELDIFCIVVFVKFTENMMCINIKLTEQLNSCVYIATRRHASSTHYTLHTAHTMPPPLLYPASPDIIPQR